MRNKGEDKRDYKSEDQLDSSIVIPKMKRSEMIAELNVTDYTQSIENQFEKVGQGWAIFWKGQQVRPKGSTNDFFASENSAKAAMVRNMHLSGAYETIIRRLYNMASHLKHNPIWPDHVNESGGTQEQHDRYENARGIHETEKPVYYFDENNPKYEYRREWSKKEPFKSNQENLSKLNSFANNALKSVIIPQLMEKGLLEFKEIK